jgi:hypothetical protein
MKHRGQRDCRIRLAMAMTRKESEKDLVYSQVW